MKSHWRVYWTTIDRNIKKIGIPIDTEKVTPFVTDSGANRNDKSYTYETFGVNKHIPCFAHMINRVDEEAIKKTSGSNDVKEHVTNFEIYKEKKRYDTGIEKKANRK